MTHDSTRGRYLLAVNNVLRYTCRCCWWQPVRSGAPKAGAR